MDYQSKVEDIVLAALTSPDAAKFPGSGLTPLEGWFFIRTGNAVKVETYVDAQNGLGVSTRNNVVAIYRDGECAKLQIGNIDIIGLKLPPPATRAVVYQEGKYERKDKYGIVA